MSMRRSNNCISVDGKFGLRSTNGLYKVNLHSYNLIQIQFCTWTPLKLNPNKLRKAFYLNEGTGEPCTGQTRLALSDILDDNLASIMLDLLGLELPMGSEQKKNCVIEPILLT